MESETVQENEHVVLETSHGQLCFAVATPGEQLKIFKTSINLGVLVGAPYGAVFELQTPNSTTPVRVQEPLLPEISEEDLHPDNEGVDNRELIDTNDSQRVTQEKINDLREQGVKPEAIVRALKEGSTTFNQKTVFSREKWLREKIKKYTRRFRVEKATMRTILDTIRAKNNAKYLNLRADSLSQILSYSNATPGSSVCVVDSTGLAIGSFCERMGCRGRLIAPYTKGGLPQQLINRFNLEQRFMRYGSPSSAKRRKVEDSESLLPHEKSRLRADEGICDDFYRFLIATPLSRFYPEHSEGNTEDDSETDALSSSSSKNVEDQDKQEEKDTSESKAVPQLDENGELLWESPTPLASVKYSEEYAYKTVAEVHKTEQTQKDKEQDERDNNIGDHPYGTPRLIPGVLAHDYPQAAKEAGIDETIMPPLKEGASTWGPLIRLDRRRLSNLNSRQRAVLYWQRVAKRLQRPLPPHVKEYLKEGLDSLVIVSDFHPMQVLLASIRFVKPSRPFVVYNTELYPLQQCYAALQSMKIAANLSIIQPWTRQYQVLDQRTHPEMLMDGSSGYILTGYVVVNDYTLARCDESPKLSSPNL